MTGLKSGSGDDLWGDDGGDQEDVDPDDEGTTTSADESESTAATDAQVSLAESETAARAESAEQGHSYIVRRAIQDKSVQFERDERLTFFVHDDVVEGERDLITELESALGRDVPKFDVREAVYRAALRNPEDVLEELLEMGYSVDDTE